MRRRRAPEFLRSDWRRKAAVIYARMLMAAEKNKEANVATRIPLLKAGFLGARVRHGPSTEIEQYRRHWTFKVGQILPDPNDQWICWFNDHNASAGIQAIDVRPKNDEHCRYLVVSGCRLYWIGDLRIIVPPLSQSSVLGSALGRYDLYAHQVVVHPRVSLDLRLSIAAHEVEHALSDSTLWMAGLSPIKANLTFEVDLEYLSMLSEFKNLSNPTIASLFLNHRARSNLYFKASKRFVSNLRRRYGMSYAEIRSAIKCANLSGPEQQKAPGYESLHKMGEYASDEYRRMYRKFLGIPFYGFQEIIDVLPVI